MRSLEFPGGGVSRRAGYRSRRTTWCPTRARRPAPPAATRFQQALGRLPANALATGTTTVNLLNPGELYALERTNLVDMRFAKILRFGGRRTDVGVDLYNLFNSNVTTAYQQTYE